MEINMKKRERTAGILLPITSLPSAYGIGTVGKAAYDFVDFLKKAGQTYWQILPVGPTGYGDSPYQSFSTFAGNPYFVDLEKLIEEGLLKKAECDKADLGDNPQYIDYEEQYFVRFPLLQKAYDRFCRAGGDKKPEYLSFCKRNADWLDDYALFMAIKNDYEGKSFSLWDADIRTRQKKAMDAYRKKCERDYGFYHFLQFEFDKQWTALKTYANENGIRIIGDIPIYVSPDSADTWANPELFQLDEACVPRRVAGCPPDYFCRTGQLWGNPLYDWEYHKKTGYEWWIRRIAHCFSLYDVVRIDHFRGFDEYYSIPYGDPTAEFGYWVKGPGMDLFDAIRKKLGKIDVIAEDLGFLTPSVIRLVKKTGYPGMKVLQFGFDPEGDSGYLPHNYPENCVVYTGTHDNDTSLGTYRSMKRAEKAFAKDYLGIRGQNDVSWACIRAALASCGNTAVIPIQDYLGLGSEARINTPSTLGQNWQWRLLPGQLTDELADKIRRMCFVYARCPQQNTK